MRVEFEIPVDTAERLLGSVRLPEMARVRQRLETPPAIDDIEGEVQAQLRAVDAAALFPRGSRVAVGVGSRGIGHLPRIVAALVSGLRGLGCEPFIVPTMGSHGGPPRRDSRPCWRTSE